MTEEAFETAQVKKEDVVTHSPTKKHTHIEPHTQHTHTHTHTHTHARTRTHTTYHVQNTYERTANEEHEKTTGQS